MDNSLNRWTGGMLTWMGAHCCAPVTFRWNNDPGWQFSLDTARSIHPGLTSFEEFVRRHGIRNL